MSRIDTRLLGDTGLRISEIAVCLGDSPERDAVVRLALERGAHVFSPDAPPGGVLVRYNLMDQTGANLQIPKVSKERKGVVATHVLAGGALAGKIGHAPRGALVRKLRVLVKPDRTLAQAAIQFVLANESVSCALVRVSTAAHLEEALGALQAPPLTGQDLEQIFEIYANRFD